MGFFLTFPYNIILSFWITNVVVCIVFVTDCRHWQTITKPKAFANETCIIDPQLGVFDCMIVNSRMLNEAYRETFY